MKGAGSQGPFSREEDLRILHWVPGNTQAQETGPQEGPGACLRRQSRGSGERGLPAKCSLRGKNCFSLNGMVGRYPFAPEPTSWPCLVLRETPPSTRLQIRS